MQLLYRLFMFSILYIFFNIYANDYIIQELYIMQEKSVRKIIKCDASAYNTHPDLRPHFRRKKGVLCAENYSTQSLLWQKHLPLGFADHIPKPRSGNITWPLCGLFVIGVEFEHESMTGLETAWIDRRGCFWCHCWWKRTRKESTWQATSYYYAQHETCSKHVKHKDSLSERQVMLTVSTSHNI